MSDMTLEPSQSLWPMLLLLGKKQLRGLSCREGGGGTALEKSEEETVGKWIYESVLLCAESYHGENSRILIVNSCYMSHTPDGVC